jgi:hypothetical protein
MYARTHCARFEESRRATKSAEQRGHAGMLVAPGPFDRKRAVVVFDARYRLAGVLALSSGLQIFD